MNLCSDKHEQICYEGHGCPMCALMDELKTEREEVVRLENEVSRLEADLENAQSE